MDKNAWKAMAIGFGIGVLVLFTALQYSIAQNEQLLAIIKQLNGTF